MYIVTSAKLKANETYSFSAHMKRFFSDTLEELSGGSSAHKNYSLGDTLYFYEIKDTLKLRDVDDEEQVFTFKIFEEISYKDVVSERKDSYLRVFKFAENIDSISTSNRKGEFLDDLMDNFDFLTLLELYEFMINKKKKAKNNNFDELISLYELAMIDKSYEYDRGIMLSFSQLIRNESINREKLVDRFKSIISSENEFSQEYIDIMNEDNILKLKDLDLVLPIVKTWLSNSVGLLLLESHRNTRKVVLRLIDKIDNALNEINLEESKEYKSDINFMKKLIKSIKIFC